MNGDSSCKGFLLRLSQIHFQLSSFPAFQDFQISTGAYQSASVVGDLVVGGRDRGVYKYQKNTKRTPKEYQKEHQKNTKRTPKRTPKELSNINRNRNSLLRPCCSCWPCWPCCFTLLLTFVGTPDQTDPLSIIGSSIFPQIRKHLTHTHKILQHPRSYSNGECNSGESNT